MKLGAAALALWVPIGAIADLHNQDTDWMPGTVGAFMHWWPDGGATNKWSEFDVQVLKEQLVEIGVDYFIFTLGQNANFYNAPNDVYERLAGHDNGSCCSRRDIPAEIIAALRGTGIRFGLYSPCQPSFHDAQAEERMGFKPNPNPKHRDWLATDEGVRNWSKVLKCWSDRYPGEIALWWFDGAYARLGYTEEHGSWMRDALKAANPHMVMAFNGGSADWGHYESWQRCCEKDSAFAENNPFRTWLRKTDGKADARQIVHLEASDFIAGETEEPMRFMPDGRWIEGRQYFILTYLGHDWNGGQCRYPDDLWIPWLRECRRRGASICFDMGRDGLGREAKTGTFVRPHLDQLRRLIRATKP